MLARSGVNAWLRARAQQHYKAVCEAVGLTLASTDAPFPRASGSLGGHATQLWVDELRTFGLDRQFVRIRVGVAGVPELFIRSRRTEVEPTTWREVLTGDLAFDDTVRVSAPDPTAARAWLTPARRAALVSLSESVYTWSVGDGVLGLSSEGLSRDVQTWRTELNALTTAATRLEAT